MAASDHLSEQLFHASPNVLKKGNIIRPLDKYEDAWAGDKQRADRHAQLLHEGYGKSRHRQLALWHPVYEVEPLKTDRTLERTEEGQPKDMKTYRSAKGFRVKGFSHLVEKEQ